MFNNAVVITGLTVVLLVTSQWCNAAGDTVLTSVAESSQVQVVPSPDIPTGADVTRKQSEPPVQAPLTGRDMARCPVKGAFNFNFNYPGAALRYFMADGKALELLGQFQKDISVGGLRYYSYPAALRQGSLFPYFAVEADYVDFKGEYSKGSGLGGGIFAGAEYFLGSRVSVQTDLGALYLSVKDKGTALSEGGLEFVLNVGVNIYFGKGGL